MDCHFQMNHIVAKSMDISLSLSLSPFKDVLHQMVING